MKVRIERWIITPGQELNISEDTKILLGSEETIRKKKFLVLWVEVRSE